MRDVVFPSVSGVVRAVASAGLLVALLTVGLSGAAGAGSPPIGDWRADEGSGTALVNSSSLGATNNGTIVGNPTWIAGKHGQAIRFDGTGDYATAADNNSLDLAAAITMAAWVKPEKLGTQYLIKKAIQGGTDGYELSLAASGFPFVRFNSTASGTTFRVDSPTAYPTNGTTWMHLAATSDGTTIRLYVNGAEVATKPAPSAITTNSLALGIGAQSDGAAASQLQGALDDILLYNTALTASEIAVLAGIAPGNTAPTLTPIGNKSVQAGNQLAFTATASDPDAGTTLTYSLANGAGGSVPAGAAIGASSGGFTWTPTASQGGVATFDVCASDGTANDCETITVTVTVPLVGDWKAEEGSGTTLINSSSVGVTNNGTIVGNPTWIAGKHGQAIRFSGLGDYATVTDNSSLDLSGAITMAAWVKPERATTTNLIKKAATSGTTANGYELSLSASTAAAPQKVFARFNQVANGDALRINSTTTYPSNGTTWMHVAATYDGATIRLYVNGVQEGQLAATFAIATNNLALGIGAQPDGSSQLQGALDDVLLYNTALTASEIEALAASAPANTSPTLNPVGNKSADVGGQLAFTATATDPDAGNTLTFSLANGTGGSVPAGASITGGGSFTWTPTSGQVGTATFDVCVSDGTASDCETITVTVTAAGADPVLVGAGDIAGTPWTQDTATAALVSEIPGTVFTLGDNAYPNGTALEFANYYDPTWGAFRSRTRPAPGNHDYNTADATPYFDYFNGAGNQNGPAGDRSLGYYSYNIGSGASTWHVVVLNSECEPGSGLWLPNGCAAGSAQDLWLKNDLAAAPTNNIIAMMHKARYSSSSASMTHLQQLWQDLYDAGVDIALAGHWHNYERLAPANASGSADSAFGVRQFVVGTGGTPLTGFGTILPTSQARNSTAHGVVKFTLHASSYDWQFVPIAGQSYTDSGTASVHGAPANVPQTFTTIPVADSTGEKPQSKIWQHGGTTWAVLPTNAVSPAGTWIWRLNPDDTWSNVRHISNNTNVQADVKSIGSLTHILLHGPSPELVSVQYDATGNTYQPWSGRPAATPVSLPNSETATIDLDSTGRLWLATENVANLNVYYSDAPYTSFSGPISLASNINDDDIGVVTALPNGTIGVLWSNQTTQRFGFKVHVDGEAAGTWSADEVPAAASALPVGLGMADDHLNLAVAADGTLYAAVKTSYDTAGYPKVALLVRRPGGTWDPLHEVDQSGTRGIVLLNEQDETVRLVYTSTEGFSDIVTKKSSTSSIAFGPRSTLVTGGVNDVTSTKQNWTVRVPVMASSASTAYTAFVPADSPGTTPPAQPQGLTATPGDGSVALSWAPNSDADLRGYNLYRSSTTPVPTTGTPVNGTSPLTAPSYVDAGLSNGTTYHYVVVAVDTAGNASTPSAEAFATPMSPGGHALSFNGSTQYVTFGPAPGLGAARFTLETWFRRTGAGGATQTSAAGGGGLTSAIPLVTKGRGEGDGTNVDMNYFLGIDTSNPLTPRLAADFEEGPSTGGTLGQNHAVVGTTSIANDTWYHAAATYDGQTWKLYLNGVLENTLTLATPRPPRSDSIQHAGLGTAMTSTGVAAGFFQGSLDEARIWNVARTGSQVRAARDDEIPSAAGLIGRFGMDEGAGTSVTNSAGTSNGTAVGGPTWVEGFGFPQDSTAPGAPGGFTATPGDTRVTLAWSANGDADLAGYNLYRSTSPPVELSGTPLNGSDLLRTTTYSDGGRTNGTTYYYALVAVDGADNRSAAATADATPIPPPPISHALDFNGSSQYVTMGPAAGLGATRFTLETWFKRTGSGVGTSTGAGGIASAVPLVTKGRGEGDGSNLDMNYFLGIDATSGKLVADFEDAATGANHPASGATTVTSGVWHHAAATYDGSYWRLYLDGALDAKVSVAAEPRADSIQHAGLATAMTSTGLAAGFFQGNLDEARIWNLVRTSAQLRASRDAEIVSAAGLRGRFGMNDGSGTTLRNSAGSPDGTLVNSPAWIPGYAFPQDATAPAPPASLAATGDDATVTVSWAANGESDLAGYDLYRSTTSPVATSGSPLNGSDLIRGTTYADGGLTNGTTYYYALVAVDGSNNHSGVSGEVSATPAPGDPVLVGAGDIAKCDSSGDEATATLLETIPGTVFTAGDNVYENGLLSEFQSCYGPSWGRASIKDRTRPIAGNHDYGNGSNAGGGYFDYFNGVGNQTGAAGDRSLGYYGYDIGPYWRVLALNTECGIDASCSMTTQINWLRADLAANSGKNVVAIWHRPRWSSGASRPGDVRQQALWQAVYDYGAELVLVGHDHHYERFARQNGSGQADAAHGVRQIVVGTGGASFTSAGATAVANSEIRNGNTFGVLKLRLHQSSYDWQFIPAADGTFTDSGTEQVHAAPANQPPSATVALSSSSPRTNDTLTATATKNDADGQPVSLTYVWKVNDVVKRTFTSASALTDSFSLASAGNGDRGDAVSVEVTPNDGIVNGASAAAQALVANTTPAFSQDLQDRSDDEGASISLSAPATDTDAETLTYDAENLPDGLSIAAGTGLITGTVSATAAAGSPYAVSVTATDGTATATDTFTWTIKEPNQPPSATVALSSSSPRTNDTLTATATKNDADGQPVSLTYVWKVNDVVKRTFTSASALTDSFSLASAGNGDRGDAVSVEVTPNDGIVNGASAAAQALVANTTPAFSQDLQDRSDDEGASISLSAPATDTDAETLTYDAENLPDGLSIAAGTGLITGTVSATAAAGSPYAVSVTATDGTATATDTFTWTIKEPNQPPVVASATINQPAPRTNDTLTATVTANDPDGDGLTYTYQWTKNGTDIAGANGDALDLAIAGNGDRGDQIAVRATASDGSSTSSPLTSGSVAVENSPPTATLVLNNHAPGTNAVLTATATHADADADPVSLTYVWSVNGTVRQTTSGTSSLTDTFDLSQPGNGDAGDTITVEATPTDGTVTGPTVADTAAVDAAPAPPAGLGVTLSTTAVALDWANNSEPDLAGYNVYRASASDGTYVKLNPTLLTSSGFNDATAPAQATSYYQVTAVDTGGTESTPAATSASRGIAFRSASSAQNGTAASLVLPRPAGVIAGDALVAVVDVRGTPAITPPSGWTLIRVDNSGSTMRQAAYVRIATAAEPASYAWAFSASQAATGVVLAYTGVNTANPVDSSSGGVNAGSTSITAPSLTTTGGDSALVGFFGAASNATIAPPTQMVEQGEILLGGKQKLATEAADALQAFAGDTGPRTASAAAAAANVGQLVALRPAHVIAPQDNEPPTAPTNLAATAASSTQVDLTWTPSNDNVGIDHYEISRNSETVGISTVARFSETGLFPATMYTYTVRAIDAAGNPSSASNEASATTLAAGSAGIVFRGASTGTNRGSTSLAINRPAAAQSGDVLLASLDVGDSASVSAPTGWTLLQSTQNGTAMTKSTYVRAVGVGEAGTYTWTLSAGQPAVGIIVAYSGVDAANPVEAAGGQANASSTAITSPTVTVTSAGALLVSFAGIFSNASITPPTGMTERSEASAGAGSSKVTGEVSDQPVGVGSTGARTANASKAAANVGHAIALRRA